MNISPINNTSAYSSVQKNSATPSFGMAWDRGSKQLYGAMVDRAVESVFSKHGMHQDIFSRIQQHSDEKKILRLADKIGKMIQEQDFLSNAHLKDFYLNQSPEGVPQILAYHIRSGELHKVMDPNVRVLQEGEALTEVDVLKTLKDVLGRSKRYLRTLENGRINNNERATRAMRRQIEETTSESKAWAAEQIAEIKSQAGRDIARGIGDAHAQRAARRINGSNAPKNRY